MMAVLLVVLSSMLSGIGSAADLVEGPVNLCHLEMSLRLVARNAYLYKAEVINGASDIVVRYAAPGDTMTIEAVEDRLFVLMAVAPLLQDIHSAYFERAVHPRVQAALERYSALRGKARLGDFPRNQRTVPIALRLLQKSLSASMGFVVSIDDLNVIREINLEIGRALAAIESGTGVEEALGSLRALGPRLRPGPVYARIVSSPRTGGLGLMAGTLSAFLGVGG